MDKKSREIALQTALTIALNNNPSYNNNGLRPGTSVVQVLADSTKIEEWLNADPVKKYTKQDLLEFAMHVKKEPGETIEDVKKHLRFFENQYEQWSKQKEATV